MELKLRASLSPEMNQFSRSIALWLVLGLMFLLLFNIFSRPQTREPEIIFSDFLNQADKGQVSQVTIQGNQIHGVTTAGEHFKTYAPNDPELVKTLRSKSIKIAAKPPERDSWRMLALEQGADGVDVAGRERHHDPLRPVVRRQVPADQEGAQHGFVGKDAHSVAVDPITHRLYFPLADVKGRAVLRVLEPKL